MAGTSPVMTEIERAKAFEAGGAGAGLRERLASYAPRRPFSIPAMLRSSSMAGQWMPIGMIS
jgi:hypothetical protein